MSYPHPKPAMLLSFIAAPINLRKFIATRPEGTRPDNPTFKFTTLPDPKLQNHYPPGPAHQTSPSNLPPNLSPNLSPSACHTAPESVKFATLSLSAFLVVCDQDKRFHIGQPIKKGGNFCLLTPLLLLNYTSLSI